MTGKQIWDAASDGDAAKIRMLLSTQGALSFINYQDAYGYTLLHITALKIMRPSWKSSLLRAVTSIFRTTRRSRRSTTRPLRTHPYVSTSTSMTILWIHTHPSHSQTQAYENSILYQCLYNICLYICLYIYICIYMYTYIHISV